MLILCSGLDSPPFPRAGGFGGGDKHVKGTDSALEADTAVQPQVQTRDFSASLQAEECLTGPRKER